MFQIQILILDSSNSSGMILMKTAQTGRGGNRQYKWQHHRHEIGVILTRLKRMLTFESSIRRSSTKTQLCQWQYSTPFCFSPESQETFWLVSSSCWIPTWELLQTFSCSTWPLWISLRSLLVSILASILQYILSNIGHWVWHFDAKDTSWWKYQNSTFRSSWMHLKANQLRN